MDDVVTYAQKVLKAWQDDVTAASRVSTDAPEGAEQRMDFDTSSGNVPNVSGVAGIKFSSPRGSGGVVILDGRRSEIHKILYDDYYNRNWAGFKKLDTSIFTMVNGEKENMFEPAAAAHFTIFCKALMAKFGWKKVTINSGWRSKKHNDELRARGNCSLVYGEHMLGYAIDIGCLSSERYTIADAAWYYGFGGIAVGKTFVHIDTSTQGSWVYSGVPKYTGPR